MDIETKERLLRLEDALKRANGLAEHFERAWYLRGDTIEEFVVVLKYWMVFIESEQDDERQAPWVERARAVLIKGEMKCS